MQAAFLISITGFDVKSAAVNLAETGSIELYKSARQLAAFARLSSKEVESGATVRGKTRLCNLGTARFRFALHLRAFDAMPFCPRMEAFYQRLIQAGKNKMQAVGAFMHKLWPFIFRVLKSGNPLDPEKLAPL